MRENRRRFARWWLEGSMEGGAIAEKLFVRDPSLYEPGQGEEGRLVNRSSRLSRRLVACAGSLTR
ncbi:hypothetical protein B5F40_07645 [Gordonibacter sp. An230]|nr:hypothetical protein B5F40_07645 [Gordonibacter sp. An230]